MNVPKGQTIKMQRCQAMHFNCLHIQKASTTKKLTLPTLKLLNFRLQFQALWAACE